MLAVERHRLLGDLLPVALVLALQLADEGLHPLHLLLRADLRVEERRDEDADDDGEDDDREREVAEEDLVERDQQVEEREEEDVPGRGEVLDPEEAGGEDGGHVRDQLSATAPGRSRPGGAGCSARCDASPSAVPRSSP